MPIQAQFIFFYRARITTINWLCLIVITPDYLAKDETMGALS